MTLEHTRVSAVADGRYSLAGGTNSWSEPNLSYWLIPDELVTDGVNTFEIELRGSLFIHAAYVSSHPYVAPDPDPDPCPECPVAS